MDTGDLPLPRPLPHIPSLGSREEDWGSGREPDRTPLWGGLEEGTEPHLDPSPLQTRAAILGGCGGRRANPATPTGRQKPTGAEGGKRKTPYPWVRGRKPPWVWTITDCLLPREKGLLRKLPSQDLEMQCPLKAESAPGQQRRPLTPPRLAGTT